MTNPALYLYVNIFQMSGSMHRVAVVQQVLLARLVAIAIILVGMSIKGGPGVWLGRSPGLDGLEIQEWHILGESLGRGWQEVALAPCDLS